LQSGGSLRGLESKRQTVTAGTVNHSLRFDDPQEKVKIMESYRDLRQERALANWQRHSLEWQMVEQRLSEKARKVSFVRERLSMRNGRALNAY